MKKQERGITLIALTITIVVLLILAVVAIRAVQGNGIIAHAIRSRENHFKAQAQEELQLALNELKIESSIREIDEVAFLQNKLGKELTSIQQTTGKGNFATTYKGYEFVVENYRIVNVQKIEQGGEEITPEQPFDKEAWDIAAASEDAFTWQSDDPTSADYGIVIGYTEKAQGYTTLRYPTRCTEITKNESSYEDYIKEITKVELPETVIKIGTSAFGDYGGSPVFRNLTEIMLPNTLTGISSTAFSNCTKLKSIIIPDSVTWIGDYAFSGCTNLTTVTLPNNEISTGNAIFSGCTSLTTVNTNGVSGSIHITVFSDTPWYENQPDGLMYIGKIAYKYIGTMPENTTIEITEGTTYISDYAFLECTNLINIIIPDSVTNIGKDVFNDTLWYKNQPDGLMYIGKMAYKYKGTMPENTTIEIAEGTKVINASAFNGYKNLINIIIPDSVTDIRSGAFYTCTGITNIIIPDSVDNMGAYVFAGWTSSQTINCRVGSKPDTWNSSWAGAPWSSTPQSNIVFGYNG